MEQFRTSEEHPPHRSSFVTVIAVISFFAACYQFYEAYTSLAFIDSLSAVSGLGLSSELVQSMMPSRSALAFEMILSVLLIGASVMLVKRVNAGRMVFIGILTVNSLWSVGSSIRTYSMMREAAEIPGIRETSLLLIAFTSAVTLGINFYVVRRLMGEEIKNEFSENG